MTKYTQVRPGVYEETSECGERKVDSERLKDILRKTERSTDEKPGFIRERDPAV